MLAPLSIWKIPLKLSNVTAILFEFQIWLHGVETALSVGTLGQNVLAKESLAVITDLYVVMNLGYQSAGIVL